MDNFGNFGEPNNSFDGTDLNYSPEGVQASVDSIPAEQTNIEVSETPVVTQPQTTQEQGFYDEYGRIKDPGAAQEIAYAAKTQGIDTAIAREQALEKEHETGLTEQQEGNRVIREGLKKKYPHIFETFILSDGTSVDIERIETSALSNSKYGPPNTKTLLFDSRLALTNDGVYEIFSRNNAEIKKDEIEYILPMKGSRRFSEEELDSMKEENEEAPIDLLRRIPSSDFDPDFFMRLAKSERFRNDFKGRLQEVEKMLEDDDRRREETKSKILDPQSLLDQL